MTLKTFERPTAAGSECGLVWRINEATVWSRHLRACVRGVERHFEHLLQ